MPHDSLWHPSHAKRDKGAMTLLMIVCGIKAMYRATTSDKVSRVVTDGPANGAYNDTHNDDNYDDH